jgi:hypothetical protein
MRAAASADDGMDFIDDHGPHGPQHFAAAVRSEEQIQRLGSRNQDVRRRPKHRRAFAVRRVAGAYGSRDLGRRKACSLGEDLDAPTRQRQVLVDVGAERLQRGDVNDADFIGERGYNNPLGLLRAKAVRNALIATLEKKMRGVTSRIEIDPFSLGEDYPVDPTDRSDEGRARSRRVQVYAFLVPWVPFPHEITNDPGGNKGPPEPPPPDPDIDAILRMKIPNAPRKCVKVYDEVVKFLRKLLDRLLDRSPIPRRFHKKVRELAEKRAADFRDDLIEQGLKEIGLEGQVKVAARKLVVHAMQQACI